MNLYVRNIYPKLLAIIRLNLNDFHRKGIKLSQSDYIIQLLEKALNSEVDQYKKDIFDQTIAALIDKFEKYIQSNNELLKLFSGIEVEEEGPNEG